MQNTLYFLWDRYHFLYCMGNWSFQSLGDVLKVKSFISGRTFLTANLYSIQQCSLSVKNNPKKLDGNYILCFLIKKNRAEWRNVTGIKAATELGMKIPHIRKPLPFLKGNKRGCWGGRRERRETEKSSPLLKSKGHGDAEWLSVYFGTFRDEQN